MRHLLLIGLAALLTSCQAVPAPTAGAASTATSRFEPKSPEALGEKFARNRCADCHSVDYGETSPLPDAPSFVAIANTPDLTSKMLAQWMKDHRNYPNEMYFEIPAEHIDEVVAYMLTLRSRGPEAPR